MSSVQLTLNQVMQLVDSARQIDKADAAVELLRDWAVGAEKEIDRLTTEVNLLRNERNEALDSATELADEAERLRAELRKQLRTSGVVYDTDLCKGLEQEKQADG